jgi:NAD(P)-dependent dehydrogenase (short-subunit alcohol dehydrogenase family)
MNRGDNRGWKNAAMRKTALISGGSRGIGAATAVACAQAGFDVAVVYRERADVAARVVTHCVDMGAGAIAVQADVSVEADVVRAFHEAAEQLGPLAALVNNAGIVAPQSRVEDLDMARVERMMQVNVVGAFLCAREAVRRMSTRHGAAGGSIVNISSRAAVLGSAGEYVDYAASKAAVDTMTVGLAHEVAAEGIRVNAVRPGIIDTEIHASGGQPDRAHRLRDRVPLGRPGRAEEVAAAIVWLLSDQATYVTGALLDVSGGR